MSEEPEMPFTDEFIQDLNEKTIRSQLFTPDNVYIELKLFKDIPLGVVNYDLIVQKNDPVQYQQVQVKIAEMLPEYQKRMYDTIDPLLGPIGYTDSFIDSILANTKTHDHVFLLAPATEFLSTLARHTARNENNSKPADKYTKKYIGDNQYVMEPIPVTYWINTFPLKITPSILERVAEELGEAFGVNIIFLYRDPEHFTETDWKEWLAKITCFYCDDPGKFLRAPLIKQKQGDLQFVGTHLFARKRLEREVYALRHTFDLEQQIQVATSQLSMFCDFEWIPNNDVRLTEEPIDVPMTERQDGATNSDVEQTP